MSLRKSLLAALKETPLQKKEDPKAYAKLASTGFLLAHPVKINGKDTRHDNGIKYHASIKFFDKENDNTKDAHETASKLDLTPPNPKDVKIEPKVLKDRDGNDVYAIGLHGKDADRLKSHHEKFSHMGHKENYKWGAHISVPKSVHDEIKAKGHKTAHDAGIEFGHAELKRGPTTLKNYGYKDMKKSEDVESISESNALENDEDAHALMNRKENKYFLPRQFLEKVTSELTERLALGDIDTDTRYTRNRTVYLDNKDLTSLRDVICKNKPRMKIRIRQYSPNELGWEQVAYAEFKIKEEDGQTKKIRVRIPSSIINQLSNGGAIVLDEFLVNINRDIDRRLLENRVRAINSAIARRGLTKQIEVQYERRAYSGKNLRITIDDRLIFLDAKEVDHTVKVSIGKEERWSKFIKPYIAAAWDNPIVMEVKSDKEIPNWLKRLLDEVLAEEVSFSKYAAAMVTSLKTDKTSGNVLHVFQENEPTEINKSEQPEMPPLTKPYSSEAQRRWAHTEAGKKALGGNAGVHEWDEATKGKKLPEKVGKSEQLEKAEKVDIAVVVLKDGNFVLVGKRRRNKKWGLPGGRNEKDGESNKAAAIRELEEEAGIKLNFKDLTLAGIREIKTDGEKKRVHVYTAEYPGGEPTIKNDPDKEFTKWRWMRCEDGKLPDEILDDEMSPPTEAAFDELDMTKNESLEKGAVKNALAGAAMATALASPHATDAKPQQMSSHAIKDNGYSREKMLNAISQVESSGGKNMNHKPTSIGTAYGSAGIMPSVIYDTIRLNPDLKNYKKAMRLKGDELHRYLQDNPKLEQLVIDKHLNRLEHHFGTDPATLAFSWNQGITNTNKALKNKVDIHTHPYVIKVLGYYGKH